MITLDRSALNEALRILNIHDTVQVVECDDLAVWCDAAENTWGLYKSWRVSVHFIVIRRQDSLAMSRSLFHELVHVKQAELAGSWATFMGEYVRQLREGRACSMWKRMLPESEYLRNRCAIPYEAEAIEISNALIAEPAVELPYKRPTSLIEW